METINQTAHLETSTDLFEQQQKGLPGMLNVLTILTFIGCGIAYLSSIYSFFTAGQYEKNIAEYEELQDQMAESEMASKMMEGSIEMMKKSYDYRYIILATTLIATTLCLIGALQMRKLKQSGFTLYTIGELSPIVVSAVLIGFSFMGGIAIIVSAVFAGLFVILYATQRKYLVK